VNGQATLTTILLPSGVQSLKAYYNGNSNDAPSTSAILTQTVNAGPATSFGTPAFYPVGNQAQGVAVGDFNGDGRPDLAVASYVTGVGILLGNGDGTFQPAVIYTAGANPGSVAVGDFNNDGKPDLAVGNENGVVSVLLGNGDGRLQRGWQCRYHDRQ
jgi:hypothetical protein